MYGYIKTDKLELKYKQYINYRRLYCSVCNSLKDCLGLQACLLTSYDATFFLAFFDGLEYTQDEYTLKCPLNPMKRQISNFKISKNAMYYVAFISAFYYYAKTKDNIIDEGKRKYRRRLKKFDSNSKYLCLLNKDKALISVLNKKLDDYFVYESDPQKDFDNLSNKIGELFGEAFAGYSSFSLMHLDKTLLYDVGFNIGKWIYLADAFDDLHKDIKNKAFNPILFMVDYSTLSTDELNQKITFMSKCLTQKIYYSIKKMKLLRNNEIIENILLFGMQKSIDSIILNRKRMKT